MELPRGSCSSPSQPGTLADRSLPKRNRSITSKSARRDTVRQPGIVVWITGLSGSGKTTIARALESSLLRDGHRSIVLDGDDLRSRISKDLGFTREDRIEHTRRIGEIAALISKAGVVTIVALISPFAEARKLARHSCNGKYFFEVHLDVSLEVCEKRDPKGLYKKARSGQISNFTGISSPYEVPRRPELRLQTNLVSPQDCVAAIRRGIDCKL